MKAARYYAPDDIRIEEAPRPAPGEGEVLARMLACGLCGTDLHKFRHATVTPGTVLGHELVARVEECGPNVSAFRPGDRIAVFHHCPCFVCEVCLRGHYSLCPSFRETLISPGGFAEFVLVKRRAVENLLLKIPDHVPDEEAALIECAACCLRAILNCRLAAGDRVAIIGAGPVGLVHLRLLKTLGAGRVTLLDLQDWRLKAALSAGADAAVNPSDPDALSGVMGRAQLVVIAAASPAAVELGMKCAGPGATVCFFAECPPGSSVAIDPNRLYHSELSLVGCYSSSPREQRMTLDLLAAGGLSFRDLITHVYPLDETLAAFRTACRGESSLKTLVKA
ncbi:MAG TPA: alcohol dehydrogenase catalytic domain-containing protein [Candidatus Brocadiia bacterium]|nr:alcohol dehydrogenase catalytic domain-containing protein [Candidatus Brocadiia bacterium]